MGDGSAFTFTDLSDKVLKVGLVFLVMMRVRKTVKCKITSLTGRKRKALEREYESLQRYLQENEDVELYSANKQQADRYYEEIKDGREYPISVRKD